MVKKEKSKSLVLKFLLLLILCGSLSFVFARFGSPENNTRRIDWVNGGGFNCDPPGYLCRIML